MNSIATHALRASDDSVSGEAEFSLADLADLDVSDIAEMRFETHPQGVYEFEVKSATLDETTNNEGEKRFTAEFELEIIGVKSVLQAGVDKESLIGKTQKEKLWINPGAEPKKVAEAIGRLRAFVADMGCESAGKLGEIITNTKGHVFTAAIVHQKDRDDKSIVYAKVKLTPKKK